jgi:periplasmic protein TonB
MFDLIRGEHPRAPGRHTAPLLVSIATHVVLIGAVAAVPLLYASAELPRVPDMLAFVAAAPPPSPPPPPPAGPARAKVTPKVMPKPIPTTGRVAPIEAPRDIVAEVGEVDFGGEEGVPGGVEGGVPGGLVGGIVGGLVPSGVLAPPSPPPVARGPVRVGGDLTAPALVSRVEPAYPPLALRAHVQGVVILEAVVDRDGRVEHVRILRSIPLLDAAAVAAVKQWRYSPLLLNGTPERFVLTVTVSFSVNA